MYFTTILLFAFFTRLSSAICPGYNYGFFNLNWWADKNPEGDQYQWRWAVADSGCHSMFLCSDVAPCNCDNDGQGEAIRCSPAPAHVDKVQIHGLWYLCRQDSNAGSCPTIYGTGNTGTPAPRRWFSDAVYTDGHPNGAAVESCCRNDGKRNLALSLISEREYLEIEATNTMLDIHIRDYAEALVSGKNLTALREVQKRELKEAEGRQLEARWLDLS